MYETEQEEQGDGWGDYYDERAAQAASAESTSIRMGMAHRNSWARPVRDVSRSFLGSMGAPIEFEGGTIKVTDLPSSTSTNLVYTPDFGGVFDEDGDYFGGEILQDLKALSYLGVLDDLSRNAEFILSTGSKGGDDSTPAGAQDENFRMVMFTFQRDHGLLKDPPLDGLITPDTRLLLRDLVEAKNEANASSRGGALPLPPSKNGGGGATPVSAKTAGVSTNKILIGVGVAALLLVGGYYALK